MDVVRYDMEASGLYVELKFDSCPLEHPGLCLCSLSIDLLSGNATSLDEQVGQCLQACEPEASAAPPPRLRAQETFGGRVAAPPPLLSPPSLPLPLTQLFMNMDGRHGSLASLTCHEAT